MITKFKKHYSKFPEVSSGCTTYNITIDETDITASDDGIVYLLYAGCGGSEPTLRENTLSGIFNLCIKSGTSPILYIKVGGVDTTTSASSATNTLFPCE